MSEKNEQRKYYSDFEEVLGLEGVTYESYLKRLCKDGGEETPITEQQWNMIVDLGIGSFKMHYTQTVDTRMQNILNEKEKESKSN